MGRIPQMRGFVFTGPISGSSAIGGHSLNAQFRKSPCHDGVDTKLAGFLHRKLAQRRGIPFL